MPNATFTSRLPSGVEAFVRTEMYRTIISGRMLPLPTRLCLLKAVAANNRRQYPPPPPVGGMKWLEKGLHAQQRYELKKAKNEQTGEYSLNCFFFASSSTQNGCTSPIRQPRSGDVDETCPWDRTGTLAVGNTKGGPTLNARLGCAAETSTKEKKRCSALGPKENKKKKQYDCRVL